MKTFYEKFVHYNIPFWIFSIIAMGLIITAFFTPPMATIDSSILYAVGEIFGYAALWALLRAIDKGGIAKIRHHDTELEIKNEKKPEDSIIKTHHRE